MVKRRQTSGTNGKREPVLDAPLQFLQTIWQLEHALERASKRMEDTLGISGPQRFALRLIGAQQGITAGELATAMHLHPSTVTGIVQRLESRKLVKREANNADGRVAHLHLTAAGAKLNRPSARGTIEKAASTVLAQCSASQQKATAAVMDALTAELMKL
ncbi:MAG: MarR family transcriptional regulator [Vicinamibacterales bacterium]